MKHYFVLSSCQQKEENKRANWSVTADNLFLSKKSKQQIMVNNETYLNASLISSSESVSFIFLAIIVRNSGKSMVPFPAEGHNPDVIFKQGLNKIQQFYICFLVAQRIH